jgi:hypothetical protein
MGTGCAITQPLTAPVLQYDMIVDEDRMKGVLHMALTIGHLFSGKDRKQFVEDTKPLIQVAFDLFLYMHVYPVA